MPKPRVHLGYIASWPSPCGEQSPILVCEFRSLTRYARVRNRLGICFFATSGKEATVKLESFSTCPIKILNGTAMLGTRTCNFRFRRLLLLAERCPLMDRFC